MCAMAHMGGAKHPVWVLDASDLARSHLAGLDACFACKLGTLLHLECSGTSSIAHWTLRVSLQMSCHKYHTVT